MRRGTKCGVDPALESNRAIIVSAYDRKDHFHQRAKREGFRSRAAYKLLEIQQSQRLLRPGQKVVDLGCWPGGWLQVAAQAVGAKGRVVGVDLAAIDPLLEYENVVAFSAHFTQPTAIKEIFEILGGPACWHACRVLPDTDVREDSDWARDRAIWRFPYLKVRKS